MKLDYLQFLELEIFTRFGTKLEAGTAAKIKRGRLLREILKQERLSPLPLELQLAWMIAYNEGLLDVFEPRELSKRLLVLGEQATGELLTLDTSRDEWLANLRSWLGPTS